MSCLLSFSSFSAHINSLGSWHAQQTTHFFSDSPPPLNPLCLTCVRRLRPTTVGTVREWARKEGVECEAVSNRNVVELSQSWVVECCVWGLCLCFTCVRVCQRLLCSGREFYSVLLFVSPALYFTLKDTTHTYWGFLGSSLLVLLHCLFVLFALNVCDMASPVVIYTTTSVTANISLARNQAIKSWRTELKESAFVKFFSSKQFSGL